MITNLIVQNYKLQTALKVWKCGEWMQKSDLSILLGDILRLLTARQGCVNSFFRTQITIITNKLLP